MSKRTLVLAVAAAFCATVFWTCSQDDGDRCQLHSDCASGYCCKCGGAAASESDSGICMSGQAACDARCAIGGDAGSDGDADADADAGADADADADIEAEVEAEVGPETTDADGSPPDGTGDV